MSRTASRGPLDHTVMALGVGMSVFHMYVAYTGTFEYLFQRSFSFLFAAAMIFLIHRRPAKKEWGMWEGITVGATFLLAVISIGWPLWNYDYYLDRFPYVHPPYATDLFFGAVAILIVLEACRRTINLTLPLISAGFLLYTYLGPYMPWKLAHMGTSVTNIIDLQYMTTDGLWNLPMGVFSTYIFLFILFGAFLDRMGAADFYVQIAMAATGRLRGGPAKAAIVASAMTGTITGSTNANVATTGTFTIPMMKRAGFLPEVAASVEVAASTGGQLMPPVMGVSAFLIAEFTGTPYWEIVKVSIIPALLYFFSVYVIVHLEARKKGLVGLPREQLPPMRKTFREGWFFLLPPFVIIYYLAIGQTVPYAGLAGIISVVAIATLRGLFGLCSKALKEGFTPEEALGVVLSGVRNVMEAMELGARNSLPIAAACATVGIVMGGLFQSGLGIKFSSLVISLAHGSLLMGILLVGISSFVLGMGLPTSAAYIVLSVMAVPALLELGQSANLSVLAAHLIVFWYSLDSCFTPPVCVPAYTAAGIAEANPSRTAWASLKIAKGVYVMPLMFAYTPILLNGPPLIVAETTVAAVLGFLAIGGALQGHMYFPIRLAERAALVAACVALFWPEQILHILGAAVLGWVFFSQRMCLGREVGLPVAGIESSLSGPISTLVRKFLGRV